MPISPAARIGHVHLRVADLERALAFYCGVLGYVRRVAEPGQGRAIRIELTPAGGRVLESCERAVEEVEQEMLGDFDAGERASLRDALLRCGQSLERVSVAYETCGTLNPGNFVREFLPTSFGEGYGRIRIGIGPKVPEQIDSAELDGLVMDACFALYDCAAGWKADRGAQPWTWAEKRLRALVTRFLDLHTDPQQLRRNSSTAPRCIRRW